MNEETIGNKYVSRIWYRLNRQNKNWLAIICGETGSGKSYSALSLAAMIGMVHVVFTPLEFMELINSGKLQRGEVIVFDEAGVGLSSREWYSVQNKLLGTVLQTFRNLNIGCIFTTPNLSFVDVQARKLFHAYLETSHIDFEKGIAYLKAYDIQPNSRLDKLYYKHPVFMSESGAYVKMPLLGVPKPDDAVSAYYEERKSAYTKQLNEKALRELKGEAAPVKRKGVDQDAIVEKIIKNKDRYLKTYQNNTFLDKHLIGADFGLGLELSQRIKKRAEYALLPGGRDT